MVVQPLTSSFPATAFVSFYHSWAEWGWLAWARDTPSSLEDFLCFRSIDVFFLLYTSLPHLPLCILLCRWEDTESCFPRTSVPTSAGFDWQNWVQESAEEGFLLLLHFI